MGRGRQRAKQAKVARELKYFSPDTDYAALQRELASPEGHTAGPGVDEQAEPDDSDESVESVDDSGDYDWTAERR
jgi:Protein of unknown function (DUF3073)